MTDLLLISLMIGMVAFTAIRIILIVRLTKRDKEFLQEIKEDYKLLQDDFEKDILGSMIKYSCKDRVAFRIMVEHMVYNFEEIKITEQAEQILLKFSKYKL